MSVMEQVRQGRKTWIVVIACIVVLGGVALGWAVSARSPKGPAVVSEAARVEDLEDAVLASGTIHAAKVVNVGSQASGQVKRLYVGLGDRVTRGQLIAEIDASSQLDTLRTAQAQVELLQGQLTDKLAVLKAAEVTRNRQRVLLQQDATAQATLDDAQAAVANATADVVTTRAQLRQAVIAVDTAQLALGYTRITAPMDGVVIAVITEQGQTVNALQSAPTIIKLARLDRVRVQAQISEADVVRVHPGLPVYFTILGDPDQRIEATLEAIEPAPTSEQTDSSSTGLNTSANSSTTTAVYYNGLFEVPNPKGRLRVDMTAQVNIVLARARHTLTIPSAALGHRDPASDQYEVRVLTGVGAQAQVRPRRVRIGLNNHVRAQVLSGLQAGDQVVLGQADELQQSNRGPGMF